MGDNSASHKSYQGACHPWQSLCPVDYDHQYICCLNDSPCLWIFNDSIACNLYSLDLDSYCSPWAKYVHSSANCCI